MRGAWWIAALVASHACATLAPKPPRFVVVYEQRTEWCRIQVLQDTRSPACFVGFQCGRRPLEIVAVAEEVCTP